jgi:hypothetical protein
MWTLPEQAQPVDASLDGLTRRVGSIIAAEMSEHPHEDREADHSGRQWEEQNKDAA